MPTRAVTEVGKPPAPDCVVTIAAAMAADNTIYQYRSEVLGVQRIGVRLTNAPLPIGNTTGYGNLSVCKMPDSNFLCLGAEVNLSITKGNIADGVLLDAADIDIGMGTAPASNTTLATTMINILPKQDENTNANTVTVQAHSLAATGVVTGIVDAAGGSDVYLNMSTATGNVSDTAYISGTIDLFVVDLKNLTS